MQLSRSLVLTTSSLIAQSIQGGREIPTLQIAQLPARDLQKDLFAHFQHFQPSKVWHNGAVWLVEFKDFAGRDRALRVLNSSPFQGRKLHLSSYHTNFEEVRTGYAHYQAYTR